MDILITGNISTIALSLAKRLLKDGHSVVITDASDDFSAIKSRNFTAHKMNASDALFQEIYRSHAFDAVFFISALESHLLDTGDPEPTQSNIGLKRTLDLCQKTSVDQFILRRRSLNLHQKQARSFSTVKICAVFTRRITPFRFLSSVCLTYTGPWKRTLFYINSSKQQNSR